MTNKGKWYIDGKNIILLDDNYNLFIVIKDEDLLYNIFKED